MNIELKKLTLKDLDRLVELFNNKKITDSTGLTLSLNPPKITRKFEGKWLEKTIKEYQIKKPENYNLKIVLDGILVGVIGSHNIDYKNRSLEIGYWIGESYWGKGISTIALKKYLDLINKKFNPKRVVGFAFTFNPASKRVMEKCGFKLEGLRKCVKRGNDKFYDDYQLSKIK